MELDFGLGRLTSHLCKCHGWGEFGAILESGSASESQSQTQGTCNLASYPGSFPLTACGKEPGYEATCNRAVG